MTLETNVLKYFAEIPDPRSVWKVRYALPEILLLLLCGVTAGAETLKDVVSWGRLKLEYLRQFSPFSNGIPSEDTVGEVLSKLNPKAFQACFIEWVNHLNASLSQEIVAIDGKALRRSFDKASKQPALQMVSAWACKQQIILAQEAVDCKSNEITAIPALLDLLVLKGAIVTLDAMGCQTAIAEAVVAKQADYVLALKGNQGSLAQDVSEFFTQQQAEQFRHSVVDTCYTVNKAHGRVEERFYYSSSDVEWLKERHPGWKKLTSIAMVESVRTQGEKTTREKRFYVSSLPQDAKRVATAIRSHWGIENQLHWVLDVTFKEDECRVRKDHAPRNFSTIRQLSLNLIRKAKGGQSVRIQRKLAGWDETSLTAILSYT